MRSVLVLAFGLALPSFALAKSQAVPLDKLPEAVKASFAKEHPGAKLTRANTDDDGAGLVYELKVEESGAKLELQYKPTGELVAVERSVKVADVPPAVVDAAKKKYAGAKPKHAVEITKDGTKTYELVVGAKGKKEIEATFAADGAFLKEEVE